MYSVLRSTDDYNSIRTSTTYLQSKSTNRTGRNICSYRPCASTVVHLHQERSEDSLISPPDSDHLPLPQLDDDTFDSFLKMLPYSSSNSMPDLGTILEMGEIEDTGSEFYLPLILPHPHHSEGVKFMCPAESPSVVVCLVSVESYVGWWGRGLPPTGMGVKFTCPRR